jgi:hypothetical protein
VATTSLPSHVKVLDIDASSSIDVIEHAIQTLGTGKRVQLLGADDAIFDASIYTCLLVNPSVLGEWRMEPKFAVGDRIRCVDAVGSKLLEVGKVYVVKDTYSQWGWMFVELNDTGDKYSEDRFEKVE